MSVHFFFDYFKSVIYSMYQVIFETFQCKFMFSSDNIYILSNIIGKGKGKVIPQALRLRKP